MRLPLELHLATTETRETSTGVEIDVALSLDHGWGEDLVIWTYTAQVPDPVDIPEGMSGASEAYLRRDSEIRAEKEALAQARKELAARLEDLLTPPRYASQLSGQKGESDG